MRSGNPVQGLNETRDRFPPGLFGTTGRQGDKEMIRSIRMRAIKLEVRSDVSGWFAEARGGMHHFAGDGVHLAGRKALWMFALAAPKEKSCDKEQGEWHRRANPSAAIALERKNSICCPAPMEHRTLGGFFLRSLHEFEGFAEDRILGR
jgi:hypothetical protein